jgi:alcohol dehydrogenase
MVPTTAGTGSEVTPWGTVWDLGRGRKRSIDHTSLYPRLALVDPTLSSTQPPGLTATCGFDALSHALESLWNVNSDARSANLAAEAIGLILEHLPTAVHHPTDMRARTAMARAALLGGLCISVTRTAAAHSISYPLTLQCDLPHGQACSITLPALLELTCSEPDPRTDSILAVLGASTSAEGAERLRRLFRDCDMPADLSQLNLTPEQVSAISESAVTPSRMANAVRPLSKADVRRLLAGLA